MGFFGGSGGGYAPPPQYHGYAVPSTSNLPNKKETDHPSSKSYFETLGAKLIQVLGIQDGDNNKNTDNKRKAEQTQPHNVQSKIILAQVVVDIINPNHRLHHRH